MHEYVLTHLSDAALTSDLAQLIKNDRVGTARLIAHIAEFDARRLYAPAGYPSMFAYCVEELHLSEDSAYKRIRAARAARQFPALFFALADGRLHLAAISLIAPHLTTENVEELIGAATHRTKAEIEGWVARRFVGKAAASPPAVVIRPLAQLAPGRVASALGDLLAGTVSTITDALSATSSDAVADVRDLQGISPEPPSCPVRDLASGTAAQSSSAAELAPGRVEPVGVELAPGRVEPAAEVPEERYSMQLTMPKSLHDKIRRAQCLLSHAVPSGDVAKILERALDLLLAHEERRIGATRSTPSSNPARKSGGPAREKAPEASRLSRISRRERSRSSAGPDRGLPARGPDRYIPARVRRAVWERDQGRCTFVTHAGHRCSARRFLEFDHIEPVARGGTATVEGLRLRCRAHNQYAAEQAFGEEFIRGKREARREQSVRGEASKTKPDGVCQPSKSKPDGVCQPSKSQPNMVREPSCSWQVTRPGASWRETGRHDGGSNANRTRPGASWVTPGGRSSRCASAAHEHSGRCWGPRLTVHSSSGKWVR